MAAEKKSKKEVGKTGAIWYDNHVMKRILNYVRILWQVLSPLFIFLGASVAVECAFAILWMILGSRMDFVLDHREDVILALSGTAALWAAWILWKIDGREGIWYGEIRRRLPRRAILPCVGTALGVSVAGNCLLSLLGLTDLGGNSAAPLLERGTPLVVLLSTCVAAPLAEEMVFRVVIYRRLRRETGFWMAAAVSSLLLALYHGNLPQGIYALLVGAVLAFLMESYQAALAPVLAHMAANLLSVLLTWAGTGDILAAGVARRAAAAALAGAVLLFSLRQAANDGKRIRS